MPIRGTGTSSSQRPGLASFFTRASIVSISNFLRTCTSIRKCSRGASGYAQRLLKANFARASSQCPRDCANRVGYRRWDHCVARKTSIGCASGRHGTSSSSAAAPRG